MCTINSFNVQIHYEGGGSRTAATDVICPMYARVHQIEQLANDPGGCRVLSSDCFPQ